MLTADRQTYCKRHESSTIIALGIEDALDLITLKEARETESTEPANTLLLAFGESFLFFELPWPSVCVHSLSLLEPRVYRVTGYEPKLLNSRSDR